MDYTSLLKLARNTIESSIHDVDINEDILDDCKQFNKKQGVFVTLHKHGELRGCIGFPYPHLELYKAVIEAARSAAFNDPRFSAVKEDELNNIDIEISVLTEPETINPDPSNVRIGTDGLIIKKGFNSGLLLPQVFTEYNASPEEALQMTCQKAGLSKDAWKDAELQRFQAIIIRE